MTIKPRPISETHDISATRYKLDRNFRDHGNSKNDGAHNASCTSEFQDIKHGRKIEGTNLAQTSVSMPQPWYKVALTNP